MVEFKFMFLFISLIYEVLLVIYQWIFWVIFIFVVCVRSDLMMFYSASLYIDNGRFWVYAVLIFYLLVGIIWL